jgi:hypothetical protein
MCTIKKKLILLYLACIIIFGMFFTPVYSVWGNDNSINGISFEPIWQVVNTQSMVNGYTPRFELCVNRIIYEFVLLTIIFIGIYFVVDLKSKKNI